MSYGLKSVGGRAILVFLIAGCCLLGTQASAGSLVGPVNKNRFTKVAIRGYDPVAYFDQGRPVEGSRQFKFEWQGATWLFASADHRDKFAAAPDSFAPQYGGYCAYAVSQGLTASIDPNAWKIVNGKLYLNLNKDIQGVWNKDIPLYIRSADQHWPQLHSSE